MSNQTKTSMTTAEYRQAAPIIPETEPLRLETGDRETRYVIRFALDAESEVVAIAVDAFRTADDAGQLVLALPYPADTDTPDEYFRRLFLLDRNRERLTDAVTKYRRYKAQQTTSGKPKRPAIGETGPDANVEIKKSGSIFQMIISPYKH